LESLEDENRRLKKLLTEAMLDNAAGLPWSPVQWISPDRLPTSETK
jgi:hypothetical protein